MEKIQSLLSGDGVAVATSSETDQQGPSNIVFTPRQPVIISSSVNRHNSILDQLFMMAQKEGSIGEHIKTLYDYATKCKHISECNSEYSCASWAFVKGLVDGKVEMVGDEKKKYILVNQMSYPDIGRLRSICKDREIDFTFMQGNDICMPLERTDLLFIDTWHVYGHMKRELEKFHSLVGKYIIMHDTSVDDYAGETIRRKWNSEEQSLLSGYPIKEVNRGIWPAIEEFLDSHPDEWDLLERFENCNGLTILQRKSNMQSID